MLITGLLLLNLQSSGSIVEMFTDIIIIATLTALVPYMYAAAAQLYLFFADRDSFSAVHLARYSVIALPRARLLDLGDLGRRLRSTSPRGSCSSRRIPVYLWLKWRQSREAQRGRRRDHVLDPFTAPPLVGAGRDR